MLNCFCRRPPVPPGAPSSSTWALGRRPPVPPGVSPSCFCFICVYIVECKLLTSLFSAALLLKTFHNAPRPGTSIRHPSPGRTSVPRADISCVVFCLFFFSFYIGLAVAADPYIEEVLQNKLLLSAPSCSTWGALLFHLGPGASPSCSTWVSPSCFCFFLILYSTLGYYLIYYP